MNKQLRFITIAAIFIVLTPVILRLTQPGRAAGSVVFVNDGGLPLVNANLRVLCYASAAAGAPIADLAVTTTSTGTPSTPLPANCLYLAAMQLQHTQPASETAHGPAYWVYTTSWAPGTAVPQAAAGTIQIREEWTLVLFHVVASLGWDVEAGSSYLSEWRTGLRHASAYLYDLSEGQMALGPVTIYENGRFWDSADLRILPANDYRPSAYIGGLVATPTTYSGSGDTTFAPANIFLGRYWDGRDAAVGSWADYNGYATLIHEWAHYALFLYDEYQQMSGAAHYCTCADLPAVGST
ncbi:MAG: hypothetical protein KC443_09340, partial [Anaerolineales bacterium]|nr:hypothetical protein [Anaerolineales bacterium]